MIRSPFSPVPLMEPGADVAPLEQGTVPQALRTLLSKRNPMQAPEGPNVAPEMLAPNPMAEPVPMLQPPMGQVPLPQPRPAGAPPLPTGPMSSGPLAARFGAVEEALQTGQFDPSGEISISPEQWGALGQHPGARLMNAARAHAQRLEPTTSGPLLEALATPGVVNADKWKQMMDATPESPNVEDRRGEWDGKSAPNWMQNYGDMHKWSKQDYDQYMSDPQFVQDTQTATQQDMKPDDFIRFIMDMRDHAK